MQVFAALPILINANCLQIPVVEGGLYLVLLKELTISDDTKWVLPAQQCVQLTVGTRRVF
jgi:hypothetical protein